tara:strand:- start:2457 stop:2822 length:366 start_codon:yes stop_codon:yes gene_type:complete
MKTLTQLQEDFKALNDSYKANPLPAGKEYNAFVKKWKRLEAKIRNYNNSTNIMKRDGLKVTKQFADYKVEFKGVVALVFLDGCVTDYWAVNVIEGNVEFEIETFETKAEAIWYIYSELRND